MTRAVVRRWGCALLATLALWGTPARGAGRRGAEPALKAGAGDSASPASGRAGEPPAGEASPPVKAAARAAGPGAGHAAVGGTAATLAATLASGPGASARPVCLVMPFTGIHAALGERVALSSEQVLGAAGVAVRRYDDRGDGTGAAEAVGRAAAEDCVALLGGLGDEEARAVADVASALGLPLLALGASPDGRPRPGVTWARTPRAEPIAALARRLVVDEGVKTAYVLAPGTRFGLAAEEAFRTALEAAGGRVALVRILGPADADPRIGAAAFGAQVRQERQAAPCDREVVFLPLEAGAARRWLGFLEAEGVVGTPEEARCPRPIVAGTSPWSDPAALARNGAALEGARFGDVRLTGPAAGATVLEAEAADAARLLVAAVRGGPGADREGVREALDRGVSVDGATGALRTDHGRVGGRDVVTFTIRAGRPVPDDGPAQAPAP